jgi:osmotically-inducible protein OsmY
MFASRRLTRSVLACAAVLSTWACTSVMGGQCASPECADDARIGAEVKKQIEDRASLRFFNIRVRTVDRVVYLEGTVDTQADRGLVEQVARGVPGVKAVNDGIYVRSY